MPLKIVRNDITKMDVEAIVNTANEYPEVGTGCDTAIYHAAGYEELLAYRREHFGCVPEGEAFLTPGFRLKATYIIHAVSPLFLGGDCGEEKKLRSCYKNSLKIAKENKIRSIAFPLIATGGFGYPKEEGMRIAVDEINSFLIHNEMDIYLVVFSDTATKLGQKLYPDLEEYIDQTYVSKANDIEYADFDIFSEDRAIEPVDTFLCEEDYFPRKSSVKCCLPLDFESEHMAKLNERMSHAADSFSEYLLYIIKQRKLKNAEVYKRAIVDKRLFAKIKNNPDYHPSKMIALCLCVGAQLNLDETKDLLARAGYALSPADKTDIIFSYFIENEIYDMIELDIQLEEHGLPCIIQ